jgi:hypothetical protein
MLQDAFGYVDIIRCTTRSTQGVEGDGALADCGNPAHAPSESAPPPRISPRPGAAGNDVGVIALVC